jgi:hypothetical protein
MRSVDARTFPTSPIALDSRNRVQIATRDAVTNGTTTQATRPLARKELEHQWQTDVLPELG